jgi:proline dehydrogenase
VKKRIAGSTSTAVLNVVRDLNNRGLHATVTLLNDHVDDPSKAKYNTNAYTQFIRQLSRLHLNSDVSIRLSQIGYGMEGPSLEKNFKSIIDVANSCNQRLWIEKEMNIDNEEIMPIYRKFKPMCSTLGVEVRPDPYGNSNELNGMVSKDDIIKLMTPLQNGSKKAKGKHENKADRFNIYKKYIDALMDRKISLTVLETDPKLISRIIALNKEYKKNLIFEIPLGYSTSKMNELQKGKLNLSVYVPYGKDWIPYFINRLAEGRVRNIAVALLNGEKSGVSSNVKNKGAKAG